MVFNEEECIQRFNAFFRNADFSSTYKPVFLKSIMYLADYDGETSTLLGHQWLKRKQDKLEVDLNFLSVWFAKYYWDMYYKFRLRQSHNPSDANIHNFFKDTDQNPLKPPTIEELADEENRQVRRDVIRKSIKPEVLGKLDKDLRIYEIIKGKNYVIFEYDIIHFLNKYRGILLPAVNYVLTRYLERINFSPRIAEKVRGIPPRDHLSREEKEFVLKESRCFYCGILADRYHIDHVVPFDYLFSTELFNAVAACGTCNSIKSNRLPIKEIFDRVLERNRKLTDKDYSPEWYQNLYRKCIVEYQGKREYFRP